MEYRNEFLKVNQEDLRIKDQTNGTLECVMEEIEENGSSDVLEINYDDNGELNEVVITVGGPNIYVEKIKGVFRLIGGWGSDRYERDLTEKETDALQMAFGY